MRSKHPPEWLQNALAALLMLGLWPVPLLALAVGIYALVSAF